MNWDDSEALLKLDNCYLTEKCIPRIPYLCHTDWKNAETPIEAMKQFFDGAREGGKDLPPLQLSLDSGDNDEERDSTLISFYKGSRDKSQWAAPFNCRILGIVFHTKKHIYEKKM